MTGNEKKTESQALDNIWDLVDSFSGKNPEEKKVGLVDLMKSERNLERIRQANGFENDIAYEKIG
jgi:hypothetical protein